MGWSIKQDEIKVTNVLSNILHIYYKRRALDVTHKHSVKALFCQFRYDDKTIGSKKERKYVGIETRTKSYDNSNNCEKKNFIEHKCYTHKSSCENQ